MGCQCRVLIVLCTFITFLKDTSYHLLVYAHFFRHFSLSLSLSPPPLFLTGVGAATKGALTFMVGGPKESCDLATPLLECMGKAVMHCGDIGAGQAAKICNNMLLGISMMGVSEALQLGRK